MSTIQGMFNDRDVEARFAPDGCERLGPGHYRRKSQNALDRVVDEMHETMRDPMREESPPPPYELYKQTMPTPLEIIATHIRTMPYADVVAMAEGTGTDPGKLWDWATK